LYIVSIFIRARTRLIFKIVSVRALLRIGPKHAVLPEGKVSACIDICNCTLMRY